MKANCTTYWLPTIPMTPIDMVNRRAAATGSMDYARMASSADYNGHHVSVSFKKYAVAGPTWNAQYHWGERVVLGRGSFETCIRAAIQEYERGAKGSTVMVCMDPEAPEPMAEQLKFLAGYGGFHLYNGKETEAEHKATYWTGKHEAVSDAFGYQRIDPKIMQVALDFEGTPEEWPAAREAFFDERLQRLRRPAPATA